MFPAPFRVVLDANVLYPFTLRDTLLRCASDGLYQAYWSEQILDELGRNLRDRLTAERVDRLVRAMSGAFPEAMVTGHEPLVASMPNHPKDRHVAAAAVKVGAQVIVTQNLRDFRVLPEGIHAESADEFLVNLLELDPDGMLERLQEQAAALRKPARSLEELLRALGKTAPEFAAEVRRLLHGAAR